MSNIYFTSDQHFFHDNIIHYCKRPFDNIERMNKILIQRYNAVVQEEDTVYFLGDVGFDRSISRLREVVSKLKGKKILIQGNHDKQGRISYLNMGFCAVLEQAEIIIGKKTFTMGHYPRRTYKEFFRLLLVYLRDPRQRKKPLRHRFNRLRKEWRNHRLPTKNWHICGHVHEAWKTKSRNINVSVDQWGFKPVSYGKIVKLTQER